MPGCARATPASTSTPAATGPATGPAAAADTRRCCGTNPIVCCCCSLLDMHCRWSTWPTLKAASRSPSARGGGVTDTAAVAAPPSLLAPLHCPLSFRKAAHHQHAGISTHHSRHLQPNRGQRARGWIELHHFEIRVLAGKSQAEPPQELQRVRAAAQLCTCTAAAGLMHCTHAIASDSWTEISAACACPHRRLALSLLAVLHSSCERGCPWPARAPCCGLAQQLPCSMPCHR